jgi:uncharacterized membrane protein
MALEISDAIKKSIVAAFLFIIIDIPWLTMMSSVNTSVLTDIQGGKRPYYRLSAALPVYAALAYLVQQVKNTNDAFFTGLSVYAVYDFTVYVAFDKYPLWLACADALWGGILFVIVFNALKMFRKI